LVDQKSEDGRRSYSLPEFASCWTTAAHQEVVDALKGEVIARAIRRHDVRLLINLLKAWMPQKYR